MAATEKTKEILECIDRLVAEEQNKERLAEIQVRMLFNHAVFLGAALF
jgi:hypothetical protein